MENLLVFLVEDMPQVREVVIENLAEISGLKLAGYAEGEDDAVSWLRNHACDILILDLELKQGNGIGVLKRLAIGNPLPDMTTIIYSNHVGDNVRRLAARFGAAHFFDKTLDARQLRLVLERLCAARH